LYLSSYEEIYFEPNTALLPDTTYTITIDTSVRSASGAKMPQPYTFSFTTANSNIIANPLYVQYSNPSNGDSDVSPQQTITFEFNEAVDTASLRKGFSLVPPVAGLFGLNNVYQEEFSFSPIMPLPLGTTYTVTLAASVKSTNGDSLGTPYTFTFKTEPFEVTSAEPYNGSTEIGLDPTFYIYTSGPIDTSTVRAAFSISPAVSGQFYFYQQNGFVFSPATTLQPYTVYTITISTALKSTSGTPLAAPYSYSVATGGN
jgi:hypothetical protein